MAFWNTKKTVEEPPKPIPEPTEEELKEAELEEKARNLIITTIDIRRDYDIIGVASAESPWELRMDAVRQGADAIVGYRINTYAVGMNAMGPCELNYGTLVKFK